MEPRTPDAVVRVETPPGDEAQVDFGYAGLKRLRAAPRRRVDMREPLFVPARLRRRGLGLFDR
jgi:hypothetical protein